MAGFLGPLVLVLLLGNTSRLPSEYVYLICTLQVFCFLGFYVLDLFVFFLFFLFFFLSRSSSSPSVVSFCSFSLSLGSCSRSRWGLVLGLALVLIYDENRMGGVFVFFFIIIMLFFMSRSTVTSSCSSSCCAPPSSSSWSSDVSVLQWCPVPCAVDLCLLAQATWRSSSSCVLSLSRDAPRCSVAGCPSLK